MIRLAVLCAALLAPASLFAVEPGMDFRVSGSPVSYRFLNGNIIAKNSETKELSIPIKAEFLTVVEYRAFRLESAASSIEAMSIGHRRFLIALASGWTLMTDPLQSDGELRAQVFEHGNGMRHFVSWSSTSGKMIYGISIDSRGTVYRVRDRSLDMSLAETDMRAGQIIRGAIPSPVYSLDPLKLNKLFELVDSHLRDPAAGGRLGDIFGSYLYLRAPKANPSVVQSIELGAQTPLEIVAHSNGFVGLRETGSNDWVATVSPPRSVSHPALLTGARLPPELLVNFEVGGGRKDRIPKVTVDGDLITVIDGGEAKSKSLRAILRESRTPSCIYFSNRES